MRIPLPPCKDCEVRKPACQSSCDGYEQYRKEYVEYQNLIQNARQAEMNISEFKHRKIAEAKRFKSYMTES